MTFSFDGKDVVPMSSADLLNAIWVQLANDPTFLAFKGLDPATVQDADQMAYIGKGSQTQGVVTGDTIPIVLLYVRPGAADVRTTMVYNNKVVIDCFAKSANDAMVMVGRVEELIHNWCPSGVTNFGFYKASETEFATGIPGVCGHRIVFDCKTYTG